MTDEKQNKLKKSIFKGYRKQTNERVRDYVIRIVTSENKPLTVVDVVGLMHWKSREARAKVTYHATLSDAVRDDLLAKTRMPNKSGNNRVHYHPLGMHPIGDEIPVPAYSKKPADWVQKEFDQYNIDELGLESVPKEEWQKKWVATHDEDDFKKDVQLSADKDRVVGAWNELNGEQRTAVLGMLDTPLIATSVEVKFNAEHLMLSLQKLNPTLYKDVQDTLANAIESNIKKRGGYWNYIDGKMVWYGDAQ